MSSHFSKLVTSSSRPSKYVFFRKCAEQDFHRRDEMGKRTLCKSSMTYFPLGFRSAMRGVRSLMDWKSSRVSSTFTDLAMAKKWSTAFVEPPKAMTIVRAFVKAALVMMSLGLMSFSSNSKIFLHMESNFTIRLASSRSRDVADKAWGNPIESVWAILCLYSVQALNISKHFTALLLMQV